MFLLRDGGVNVHWHGRSSKMMIDGKVVTSTVDVGNFHNAVVPLEQFTYGPENKLFSRVSHLDNF